MAEVVIVSGSLQRTGGVATALDAQAHRRRRSRGESVGIVPGVTDRAGSGENRRSATKAQHFNDSIVSNRESKACVISRGGTHTAEGHSGAIDSTGRDNGWHTADVHRHVGLHHLDPDPFLKDAIVALGIARANPVARHPDVEIRPVVKRSIGARGEIVHRCLESDDHRRSGHSDTAGGRDVGNHQGPSTDRTLGEDSGTGEAAVVEEDACAAGDISLVEQGISVNHPLPGGGDGER